MERRTKLAISLVFVTLFIIATLFGGTYYLFFRKDYNWHEDFELDNQFDGSVIVVDIKGSGVTDDIDDALIMAEDGDTVRILPGEYNGTFYIKNRIRLVGNGTDTILRATSSQYLLKIAEDNPGVTIGDLRLETSKGLDCDSGIWLQSGETIVRDCEFDGNFSKCINVLDSGESIIEDCRFLSTPHYGVFVEDSQSILIKNCLFENVATGIGSHKSSRSAFVHNDFFNCGTGIHVVDGSYNVIKENEFGPSYHRDILDEGWRTKIDEDDDTEIEEGNPTTPLEVICVPTFFLFFIVTTIIIVDMILVTMWFLSWISDKFKHDRKTKEKDRQKNIIKLALEGKNIKKKRFRSFDIIFKIPVLMFNLFMFTIFLIISVGSILFFLVVDLEGEKYLCCLLPLLPIPILAVILFGSLSIASIISIKKKGKIKSK